MSIALVGGPTGVGKTSIINSLLRSDPQFVRPVAYTTRPTRPEDKQNQFTHVTRTELERLSQDGKLLSLDEVHGHLYALSRDSIEELTAQNKIVIKEFYLSDHRSIQTLYPDTLSAVIMPLSAEAHTTHIESNRLVKNRAETRGITEWSEHTEFLEAHPADIVLYNNFEDTIYELALQLGQKITYHLNI